MKNLRAGFTIIELLIFMGLIMILIGIFTSIFLTALDVQLASQATSNVEQSGNFILSRLAYDIHRADSVVLPTVGQTDGTLILSIGGESYSYAVSGSQLRLAVGGETYALTGDGVSATSFLVTRIGSPTGKSTLQLKLTLSGTGTGTQPPEVRQHQVTVGLR
jgi:type II secretory pathway pseudopilin PulG